jgi:hypothetical protein
MEYLSRNAVGQTFVDEAGVTQAYFRATPADRANPWKYQEMRNNAEYRDYFWNLTGVNLLPDNATPTELALFNDRETKVRQLQLKEGATLLATNLVLAMAGRIGGMSGKNMAFNPAALEAEMAGAFTASLDRIRARLGVAVPTGELTVIRYKDGILGEQLAAQVRKELGFEVRPLQNNSGHGVDLYGYDPVQNRYVVIEVRSSAVGKFENPTGNPVDLLKSRADLAAAGQTGGWGKVPPGTQDAGKAIQQTFSIGTPTVTGYKVEVALPREGQTGTPTVTFKCWNGATTGC